MAWLTVAVCGVGVMGKRHAENVARAVPQAKLVAVADADRERARAVAAELDVERSYGSIEDMLQQPDIQAVVIASPGKFHARDVEAAAARGKDILCEKPLAMKLADADAALRAVQKAGVRLQVGHMRRYDPAYAEATRRIEAGEIGDPVVFKSVGRDQKLPPASYFQSGMNAMLFLDSSIHDFDLARWMMADEVAELQAFGTRPITGFSDCDDVEAGVVNLRFERGAVGNVESFRSCGYGYDIRTEVIGTKATLQVGYIRQTQLRIMTQSGIAHDAVTHWLDRFEDAYLLELRDFVATMLSDRQPKVTGKDGRAALAISLAAERSYREKRPIRLSEQLERELVAGRVT